MQGVPAGRATWRWAGRGAMVRGRRRRAHRRRALVHGVVSGTHDSYSLRVSAGGARTRDRRAAGCQHDRPDRTHHRARVHGVVARVVVRAGRAEGCAADHRVDSASRESRSLRRAAATGPLPATAPGRPNCRAALAFCCRPTGARGPASQRAAFGRGRSPFSSGGTSRGCGRRGAGGGSDPGHL